MRYILHDISVALWALKTNHCDRKDCKIAVRWPVGICRAQATYDSAWLVRFRRPRLYVLNPYRLELDYLLAHSPQAEDSAL